MSQQRVIEFDIMKGVGIIMMILAHLVFNEGWPKQIIHSFHMPLFLILAGVFAKDIEDISSFKNYTCKNAKRLLLPYVITMLMLCLWGGVQTIAKHDISFFLRHFFSMLTASADGWHSQWGLIYAGPMWFLIALFLVREFFYGVQYMCRNATKYKDELVVGISIILSIASVLIYPYMPSLPYCIMQACTALAFYAVGWYIHHHPQPWWVYGLCVLVWPAAILYGGVGLDSCKMVYYPLSFIGACGGTYVVYLFCKGYALCLEKLKSKLASGISNPRSLTEWIGIYSLPILCMHDFLMYSDIMNSIMIRFPYGGKLIWGGLVAIVMAFVVLRIPILKKAYN